jgi:beta-alanine degradation protein BauB
MEASEDIGTRLIVENDRVRVWEHRVPVGGTGPTHLHRRPYFSVVVQGSSGETVEAAGTTLEHFDLEPGSVLWYGKEALPQTHALRNTGSAEIVLVTTELL